MMGCFRLLVALLLFSLAAFHDCTAQDEAHVVDAEETKQDHCDCTDECTKIAKARVTESEQRHEALVEKERKQLQATHEKEIETLQKVLDDAQKAAEASLQRANSLRKEHDEALSHLNEQAEREQQACKAARSEVEALRAQSETLRSEKELLDRLERQVTFLNKENQKLQKKTESLTKDLNHVQHKLDSVRDAYYESTQNLVDAKEEYRKLYKDFSTTYVNVKLIETDVLRTAREFKETVDTFWQNHCAPYWNMIAEPLAPWIEVATNIAVSILKSFMAVLVDVFNEYIVPFWNTSIYPKLQPKVQPLLDAHDEALASLAVIVQKRSLDVYSYIILLDGTVTKSEEDSMTTSIRGRLLRALRYGQDHGDKVVRILERALLLFIGYWMVAGLVALRNRQRRKRASAKREAQSKNDGGLVMSESLTRKKNQ